MRFGQLAVTFNARMKTVRTVNVSIIELNVKNVYVIGIGKFSAVSIFL